MVKEKPIPPLPELGSWTHASAMRSLWRARLAMDAPHIKAGPLPPEVKMDY